MKQRHYGYFLRNNSVRSAEWEENFVFPQNCDAENFAFMLIAAVGN